MRRSLPLVAACAVIGGFVPFASIARGTTGDVDGNGYLNRVDFVGLAVCVSGPRVSPDARCAAQVDVTDDHRVDLLDCAVMLNSIGHLPMPLRDDSGQLISGESSTPYNGEKTCGACHDVATIRRGFHFEQGRTDPAGNVIMKDDFFGDGRAWERSSGRFGRWSGAAARQTAPKQAENESHVDTTAFEWIRTCGKCHPGGGPGQYDRDNLLLWDQSTGEFGYELLGKTSTDVSLDGDYTVVDVANGQVVQAPWNVTGVAAPDCLTCHRADRVGIGYADMNRNWRSGVLAAAPNLTDAVGNPVPAFAAAATAGQGWFSEMELTTANPKLQIDYNVGILDGSLALTEDGNVSLKRESFSGRPADRVCWGCHAQNERTHGEVWFDERDVHFRKFNNRNDDDPTNDVPLMESKACNYCHPGNLEHNFAKGNSLQIQFRNELDYVNFRTCRDCHLYNSPIRHPDAPEVLGPNDTVTVHLVGDETTGPMAKLSCQACHISYRLLPTYLFIDTTLGDRGSTEQYLSADPLDPTNSDKSRWYPALQKKLDSDGVERWFPCNYWISMYWADWDRKGTPDDFSDDTFAPIIQWRLRQMVGAAPLPVVTDDNLDGRKEMNRPEEILTYLNALKGTDSYGRTVAMNPVFVKGKRIWFADPAAPEGIRSIEHEGTGLPVHWESYTWGLDHNVLAKENAWGRGESASGCVQCHGHPSPVFDRLVLVDPYGPDGKPVYQTIREMTGLNPP